MKQKIKSTLWIPALSVTSWVFAFYTQTPTFYGIGTVVFIMWITKLVNIATNNWGKDN